MSTIHEQTWVALPARPARELKGFAKIMVNPGETRHFEITLSPDAFAYGSTHKHDWLTDAGSTFNIEVGHSVHDIKLRPNIALQ